MKPPKTQFLVPPGSLRPETKAERTSQAKVTDADVALLKSRMAAFNTPGELLDQTGQIVTVSAAVTRALLEATIRGEN